MSKPPAALTSALLLLAGLVIGLGLSLPALHDQYGTGGRLPVSHLSGLLLDGPGAPQLLVPSQSRRYLLAGTGKTAPPLQVMAHRGQWVELWGSVYGRGDLRVMNVRRGQPILPPPAAQPPLAPLKGLGQSMGPVDLEGEIVDGKCFSGVMKPGHGKVHRGCAIRCIRGGVPAVFRTVVEGGKPRDLLLVDRKGRPVNDRVVDLIADRIRIHGDLFQLDQLFVLQSDPESYQRT